MKKVFEKIIISIVILCVLCLLGFIAYKLITMNNEPKRNVVVIYNDDAKVICDDFTPDCSKKQLYDIIETKEEGATLLSISKNHKVLYYDDGLYIYDLENKNSSKLDIDYKYISEFLTNGFIYNSNSEHYYYDYATNKKITSGNYYMSSINDKGEYYLLVDKENQISLVDVTNGESIITSDINLNNYDLAKYKLDANYIILEYCTLSGVCVPKEIYTEKGSKVTTLNDNEYYYIVSDQDNTTGGNKLVIYERTIKNSFVDLK